MPTRGRASMDWGLAEDDLSLLLFGGRSKAADEARILQVKVAGEPVGCGAALRVGRATTYMRLEGAPFEVLAELRAISAEEIARWET